MIHGLTHDKEGRTIQRLSVSTKLAVGLGPDAKAGRKAPMKLDHIIFLKKVADSGTDSDWVIDTKLTEHYGKEPREVEIILLSDDMEEVFQTQYAWWTRSKRNCWGDGLNATRKTDKHPEGEPWEPCGKECPDLQEGRCKPSGDLRFTLADFPQLGSVARIHTSSYRSIMQIHSALHQVQLITGGRLAGIRGNLVVRQEKASYRDKGGETRTTKIPALSIEIRANGMRRLVENMVDTARVFEQTRKLLGTGHIQVIEGEETAREMAGEFYPNEDQGEEPETRHTRRERERGTLEPSTEKNRGHGNEGFHDEPKKEAAKVTQIKSEPANENAGAAKSKKSKQPERSYAKVVRVEPKMTKLKPKQLEENEALKAQNKEPKYEQQPFYRLHCEDGPVLYVYDKHLFKAILPTANKPCTFMIVEGNQGYWTVEDIIDIAGVKFVRDPETKDAVPEQMVKASEQAPKEKAEITGDVISIFGPDKHKSGNMYMTATLLDLSTDQTHDPHAVFACINPELFELVTKSLNHNATFVYSKSREGKGGKLWQIIEDVKRIGEQAYVNGKPENLDAEPSEPGDLFPKG